MSVDRHEQQLTVIDPLASAALREGRPSATFLDDTLVAITAAVSASPLSEPLAVLVDSLSALAAVSDVASPAWVFFVRSVTTLTAGQSGRSLTLVAHGDVEEDARWVALCEHLADSVVRVEPLPTGQAADVNVRVVVSRPNRWGCAFAERGAALHAPLLLRETLFARVTERSVAFKEVSLT